MQRSLDSDDDDDDDDHGDWIGSLVCVVKLMNKLFLDLPHRWQ
jgi:hypothetical protein